MWCGCLWGLQEVHTCGVGVYGDSRKCTHVVWVSMGTPGSAHMWCGCLWGLQEVHTCGVGVYGDSRKCTHVVWVSMGTPGSTHMWCGLDSSHPCPLFYPMYLLSPSPPPPLPFFPSLLPLPPLPFFPSLLPLPHLSLPLPLSPSLPPPLLSFPSPIFPFPSPPPLSFPPRSLSPPPQIYRSTKDSDEEYDKKAWLQNSRSFDNLNTISGNNLSVDGMDTLSRKTGRGLLARIFKRKSMTPSSNKRPKGKFGKASNRESACSSMLREENRESRLTASISMPDICSESGGRGRI